MWERQKPSSMEAVCLLLIGNVRDDRGKEHHLPVGAGPDIWQAAVETRAHGKRSPPERVDSMPLLKHVAEKDQLTRDHHIFYQLTRDHHIFYQLTRDHHIFLSADEGSYFTRGNQGCFQDGSTGNREEWAGGLGWGGGGGQPCGWEFCAAPVVRGMASLNKQSSLLNYVAGS